MRGEKEREGERDIGERKKERGKKCRENKRNKKGLIKCKKSGIAKSVSDGVKEVEGRREKGER